MGSLFKRLPKDDPGYDEAPWQMKFRGQDGRWTYESARTNLKRKAQRTLTEREADANRGKLAPGGDELFERVAQRWLDEYSAKRLRSHSDNVSRYNAHLAEPFGALRLKNITPAAIKAWAAESVRTKGNPKGVSAATVRRAAALLRVVLADAVQSGLLHESPFKRLARTDLPKEPRRKPYAAFSDEEVAALLEASPPRDRPLYETAFRTGLRIGELAGLRWGDVDLDGRVIKVARSYDNPRTKDEEPRTVPISDELRAVLVAWKANCPETPDALAFPDPVNGRMLYRRPVWQRFQELCDKAGVRRLPFHATRHSFATAFLRHGGDLWRLKGILGHSTVELTQRYADDVPAEAMIEDVNRVEFRLAERPVVGIEPARRKRAKVPGPGGKTGKTVGTRVGRGGRA
jgi:integrase